MGKWTVNNKQIFIITSLIFITACGGGGGGGSDSSGSGYTAPTNNPPSINNTSTSISVIENQTSAFNVNASDPDGDTLSYTLSGDDASLLTISNQGVVTFNTAPDFENPSDADSNNIYKICTVIANHYKKCHFVCRIFVVKNRFLEI